MNEKYIELEIRLLLLKYGKAKILNLIERISEKPVEDLDNKLRNVEKKQKVKAKDVKILTHDLIDVEISDVPEVISLVRILISRYENKVFLPQLKDALRFIERTGLECGNIKTRRAATKTVIKALSKLSLEELSRLVHDFTATKESDFSILARGLMGESNAKSQDNIEQGPKSTKD